MVVDPVAIQIHERIEPEAIIRIATREDVEANLFSDPKLTYTQAVEFYKHDVDWSNRLILGDSLQVMSSLATLDQLAGKVQMIYIDPPYGIKFASNFQPEVGKRDVKDKETDLTREPEMVKAFRDTWHLGVHSYLSYLRDRLIAARELLADTGSVFVQISDENLHRVRAVLDEVFGSDNCFGIITFKKTGGQSANGIAMISDYLLWYVKSREVARYHQLYVEKSPGEEGATNYTWGEDSCGLRKTLDDGEIASASVKVFQAYPMFSDGPSPSDKALVWRGQSYQPSPNSHWKTTATGLDRLAAADRLLAQGKTLRYVNYLEDYPVTPIINIWTDTQISGYNEPRRYVVQTLPKVIQRCMLMTTNPGDLILDPTCGSGTTAYVAEQWGRRWITIDTSRVAVAIARQRLLTAKFDYYEIKHDPTKPADVKPSPRQGFVYKTVPHVTLKSVAQNDKLDPIFAKHEPILDATLAACNNALGKVTAALRAKLEAKLKAKEKDDGKRAVTDADRRRWMLPTAFEHWTVPFDTDPDWPAELATAVEAYRKAWRAKMDEVNACVAKSAEQEELVDQPQIDRKKVRVSGPFTVEGVLPPEMALSEVTQELPPIGGAPEKLEGTFAGAKRVRVVERRNEFETANIPAYLENMTALLRGDGVRFPNNKEMVFGSLRRCNHDSFHAEGRWVPRGETDPDPDGEPTVGVVFGPQYGPFTSDAMERLIRPASRKYEVLVIAAFAFNAEVHEYEGKNPHPRLKVHLANISPDTHPGMKGLLKDTPRAQLFTVFGSPRTKVEELEGGEFRVHMEGVDIYDPVNNVLLPTGAGKVAAWFLDGDYDGKTFCITQAFFPDKSAWDKIAKALGGKVDPERFEALSGTVSLPFPAGKQGKCAVKVIDPRGNEVMRVHTLS